MLDRVAQRPRDDVARPTGIERINLLAPARECGELVLHRPLVIGDVVDLAAKGINRVHSVPAFLRQEAHRPVERSLRSLRPLPDRFAQRVSVCLVGDGVERGIAHRRSVLLTPLTKAAAKSDLRSLTRFAKGSPRRSRSSSRAARATITPHSQRSPGAATRGGSPRAFSTRSAVQSSNLSSTRRSAGLVAPPASASTSVPCAASSVTGRYTRFSSR